MSSDDIVDVAIQRAVQEAEQQEMPAGTLVGHLCEPGGRAAKLIRYQGEKVLVNDMYKGERVWARKGLLSVKAVQRIATEIVLQEAARCGRHLRN